MSLARKIWNDGELMTTPALNQISQQGAGADDRALETLFTPGGTQKRIIPLDLSTSTYNLMVVPGATSGSLKLQPCVLIAGNASVATSIDQAAPLMAALESGLVGSNASGSTRIDLLYATVRRVVPPTLSSPPASTVYCGQGGMQLPAAGVASRSIKQTTDGDVLPRAINLYDLPTVTLTILAGTPGGGAPSLPADTAPTLVTDGVYNFSLATITVANGYTGGTAISAGNITQTWTQATVPQFLVDGLRNGTRSIKGLQVDGVGGASSSPPAGVIQSKSLVLSDTMPNIDPGAAHLGLRGSIPTLVASTGAGTSPTVSIASGSSDSRGVVTVTTGTGPSANAAIVRIQFAASYTTSFASNACRAFITPANANAAALSGTSAPWVLTELNSEFQIQAGSVALAATTTYQWRYFVLG